MKRIIPKTSRSPKELARIRAIRERFQREKPSLESLNASGEYDVVRQGDYFDFMRALAELKNARQRKKLSLAEVSRRSGIDKAALSRLENLLNANPTLKTLEVIARSIGVRIRWAVEEISAR
jgi:ribosome-binding protein aMBF1 (putative translation factor)